MGSGSYDLDDALRTRAIEHVQRTEPFSYRGEVAGRNERSVHPLLDIRGRVRECVNETPIVIAFDVTRSRGQDTRIIYDNLPRFVEILRTKGYLSDMAISFAAVGDATAGDRAPIQIGQFEADNRLDNVLRQIWIEEGGGGTGKESYELLAYYYARHTFLHCLPRGHKGYFFLLADEAPYPEVHASQVERVLGHSLSRNLPTHQVFDQLREKFHVFLIAPQTTREQRRADIDAEIRQRVQHAGGRVEGVDIRASLLWNDRNDLDISIVAPSGERIYYSNKRSRCGGWLDVDMNIRGETTKPVENIQWARGTAPSGHYQVFVENYRYHEMGKAPIGFRAELEVQGEIQQIRGTVSPKLETGAASRQLLWEFDYDPSRKKVRAQDAYDDNVILAQWRALLPDSHILRVQDPACIPEVLLGTIAVTAGHEDPAVFVDSLGTWCRRPASTTQVLTPLFDTWMER